jgi:ABC-type sugar transport system substrate-binding protein
MSRKMKRTSLFPLAGGLSVALALGILVPTNTLAASDVDPMLLAPKTAVSYSAQYSKKLVNTPISFGKLSMPYSNVVPLAEGPIGNPKKVYKICMSQALTGSTWAVAQQESVMIEAARHSNVKVIYYNTANDPLKQVADLETCIAQKVDAVLVWPHSVAPLTPMVEKIKKSGIKIVGMERTVATRNYDSWIYLDNAKATADVAAAVCAKLGNKGTVAETDGALGSSPQILRRSGFVDALAKKCPDVKVVFTSPTDYSRGQGYKVATDFLQSPEGQNIDAWYDQYTEIGFGIRQALVDAKRTDIPQFSIVDGKNAVQAVLDGVFYGVAPWTPVHGDVALRVALQLLAGKKAPKDILLTQPSIITKANAAAVLKQTWVG